MKTNPVIQAVILQILYKMTCNAFCTPYRLQKITLSDYANFTKMQASNLSGQKLATTSARMYRLSYQMGLVLRKLLFIKTDKKACKVITWLYRHIGITMDCTVDGSMTFHSCFFSKYYTPHECHIMSSMDSGICAGILGSGTLEFTTRITEGHPCCNAYIKKCSYHNVC